MVELNFTNLKIEIWQIDRNFWNWLEKEKKKEEEKVNTSL